MYKSGRHHLYQYFHGRKRPCGRKAKLMKLCPYTVLILYYLCTKEQLLTDTTTYLNYQSFNSSLITFVHAVVSPIKNKNHGCKSVLTILNYVRFSVTQKQQILQLNGPIYRNDKQESPADAVKPARRKSMQKLLQFDVFRFISPNSISPNCQCIASRGISVRLQAYIVIHSLKSGNPVFANYKVSCLNYKYLVYRLFSQLHTE